jgi:RluA family pseudouridine synthase
VPGAVKLSSPETGEFWEIPVLFEDDHLFALNKPAHLLSTADADDPKRPSLVALLHRGIERGAPWARERSLGYLMNPHRLDFQTSGAILFAKDKETHAKLADQFAMDKPCLTYLALVRGETGSDTFETDAKIGVHPLQMGVMRIDPLEGKRSRTSFTVRERFRDGLLLECRPVPDRPHQVAVHLKHLRLPLVGDAMYGGKSLFLSSIKPNYEAKRAEEERPLMGRAALHVEQISVTHPATGEKLEFKAPLPKDFSASIKYLQRFRSANSQT